MRAVLLCFFSDFVCWSFRLGAVLCWVLFAWGMSADSACAEEDTLSRISRVLADSLSSRESAPEWNFTEETMPSWQQLEPGLELGLFPARSGNSAFEVVVLRIDPSGFVFSVHTVSQSGQAFSLGEWARRHGLVAVINASMYLPDGVTSTGYLRAGETVNNGRIVSKFGAFFVADPIIAPISVKEGKRNAGETGPSPEMNGTEGKECIVGSNEIMTSSGALAELSRAASGNPTDKPAQDLSGNNFGAAPQRLSDVPDVLPEADILDRSVDNWESLLPRYQMVVQNYRLISADRRLLWTPGGPRHSIAAIGKDGTGHILFFLCREPLTGVEFGNLLLGLPIDVHVVMYAEGGSQAGLFLDSVTRRQVWMGRYFTDIWTSGNAGAPLPNVIGIRRRF